MILTYVVVFCFFFVPLVVVPILATILSKPTYEPGDDDKDPSTYENMNHWSRME